MIRVARILLLVTLLAGCGPDRNREADVEHCHAHGYSAHAKLGYDVECCSVVNGDSVCLYAREITRHRRETGQ